MRIEFIKTVLIYAKTRNWLIVKITTDDGIVGIGEATLEGRSETVATAISEMSRFLIGKDPFHIEHHYQYIYRGQYWKGGAVLSSALSGIEQGLWDIVGKQLNQGIAIFAGIVVMLFGIYFCGRAGQGRNMEEVGLGKVSGSRRYGAGLAYVIIAGILAPSFTLALAFGVPVMKR